MHCLRSLASSEITEVTVKSTTDFVGNQPKKTTINFQKDLKGFSRKGAFYDKAVYTDTLVDINDFKVMSANVTVDDCTQNYRSSTAKSEVLCFATVNDRFELVTQEEENFISGNQNQKNLSYPSSQYILNGGKGIFNLPSAQNNEINWLSEYKDSSAKNTTTVTLDDYQRGISSFSSEEELFKYLDKNLLKIRATRFTRKMDETDTPLEINKPQNGWREVLTVYGSVRSMQIFGIQIAQPKYSLAAVALKNVPNSLRKGDSGSRLIGEFLEASKPIMQIRSYRQVLGTLSSKNGDDVCTGDDLLCCNKT